MQVTVEPRTGHTVLRLSGDFEMASCAPLLEEIDRQVGGGVNRIVLDLHRVKFISSTALNAIINASSLVTKDGGLLVISRPSAFCREIMQRVGLDRVVTILDSDEETGIAFETHAV